MPDDIRGGSTADKGKTAAAAPHTPHQSFMTVIGQAVGMTLLVELGGYSPTAGRVVGVLIVGLWLAFLVNNSDALFGALTVKRT